MGSIVIFTILILPFHIFLSLLREGLSGDKLQLPLRKVEGAFLLTIYLFLLLLLLLFIFTAANGEIKDLSLTVEINKFLITYSLSLLQCVRVCVCVCVCVCVRVCAQSLSPVQLLFATLWSHLQLTRLLCP